MILSSCQYGINLNGLDRGVAQWPPSWLVRQSAADATSRVSGSLASEDVGGSPDANTVSSGGGGCVRGVFLQSQSHKPT